MHDHRRSNVSIEDAPAFAAVHPFIKRLLGDRPAFGASLGSSARFDLNNFATSICSFVAQHQDEHSPRGVVHFFGERTRRKSFDTQILDGNMAKPIDDRSGQFMQPVTPAIGDSGLVGGERGQSLRADLRISLAPRYRPLLAPHSSLGSLGPVRASNCFAGRKCDKGIEAQVYADQFAVCGVCRLFLDMETDEPLTILAREDGGFWLARQFSVPANFYFALDADDPDAVTLGTDGEAIPNAKIRGMISGCGSEPREPLLSTEERLVSMVQTAENARFGRKGPSLEGWNFGTKDANLISLLHVAQGFPLPAIRLNALLKSGVIKLAEIAQHFVERLRLQLRWIDPIFVIHNHLRESSGFLGVFQPLTAALTLLGEG